MSNFFKAGRSIVAIGRNYAAHAKELGNSAPKEPFFFLKPVSSYLAAGGAVEVPKGIEAHHEVELGVVIGKQARDVRPQSAMDHVAGYTLAIDMTGRNMQEFVKNKGLPWSTCKGFDTFCPVSEFISKEQIKDPHQLELELSVNGQTRQKGPTVRHVLPLVYVLPKLIQDEQSDMIFDIPGLIAHCSSIMSLSEGDLLLTGTPQGVSRVVHGDTLSASLTDLTSNKQLATWHGSVKDRAGGYAFTGSS